MGLNFTWDEEKAAANLGKHRVDFQEGWTIFDDVHSITVEDELHWFEGAN